MTPARKLHLAQLAATRDQLNARLSLHLRANKVPHVREYSLPGRQFRWDFAFPEARLMVEVHGGIWMAKGAHNTAAAITRDAEKGAYAAGLGWRTFAVTGDQITNGDAYEWIKKALEVTCGSN